MLVLEKHLKLRETQTPRQQCGWQEAGIQLQRFYFLTFFEKRIKT